MDAQWQRLVDGGPLSAVLPIRTEDFGQRHFIVAGPDGVLIDVITNVEAVDPYAGSWVNQEHDDQ